MTKLFATSVEIANPLYDGRAASRLRTIKVFPEGTRFCLRHHHKTQALIGVAILMHSHVHKVYVSEGLKGEKLHALVTANSVEVEPRNYDEAMMMVDPYYDGLGDAPSVSETILDTLIRAKTWNTEELLKMLESAVRVE